MLRVALFSALLSLLAPVTARAVSAPQCSTAMDVAASELVPGSLTYTLGVPDMVDVRGSLGGFVPFEGGTMCLLSTGDPANITQMQDYDWPGVGADTSVGDRIELSFDITVPPWANSFFFRHNFFSREYPEWVGSAYNDTLEINLTGAAWSGQIAFDAVGNMVTVNSAFFVVTNPATLVGTGFDQDGATGWLVTIAPVQPGDVVTLSFTIYDVADGVWDSAVLLDDFEWSTSQVTMPFTDHADPLGGFQNPPTGDDDDDDAAPTLSYLSPKEGPLDGGGAVTVVGADLALGMEVWIGAARAPVTADGDGTTLQILTPSAADAGVPAGGPVAVRIVDGDTTIELGDGFTYHVAPEPQTGPGPPPADPGIELVWPLELVPNEATRVQMTGTALAGGVVELERQDGGRIAVTTLQEESGAIDVLTVQVPPLAAGLYAVRAHNKGASVVWGQWLVVRAPEPTEEAPGCSALGPASASPVGLLAVLFAGRRRRDR